MDKADLLNELCVHIALTIAAIIYVISCFCVTAYERYERKNKLNYTAYFLSLLQLICFLLQKASIITLILIDKDHDIFTFQEDMLPIYKICLVLWNNAISITFLGILFIITRDLLVINLLWFQSRIALSQ